MHFFSGDLFTKNDYISLKARFGLDTFIFGAMPEKGDEILISEAMLEMYGLTTEAVLNKRIEFCRADNGLPVMEEATVSGVIRKEYYELAGHSFDSNFSPCVYLTESNTLGLEPPGKANVYCLEEFQTKETVLGWLNDGLIDSESNYAACGLISGIEFINRLQNITLRIFSVLGVLICAGILFTVYLLMDKYLKYFTKSGGILSMCGITQRQLNIVMYIQILVFTVIAAIISAVFVIVAYELLGNILQWYIVGELTGGVGYLFMLFGIGIAAVLITSSVIFAFNYCATRKRTVKECLDTRVQ